MSNATNTKRFVQAAGVLSLVALIAGCASTTPEADARFGDAVRGARMAQTLNPQASANRDPVKGLDGQSAASAVELYRESFKKPPTSFEVLGTTGTSTTGSR